MNRACAHPNPSPSMLVPGQVYVDKLPNGKNAFFRVKKPKKPSTFNMNGLRGAIHAIGRTIFPNLPRREVRVYSGPSNEQQPRSTSMPLSPSTIQTDKGTRDSGFCSTCKQRVPTSSIPSSAAAQSISVSGLPRVKPGSATGLRNPGELIKPVCAHCGKTRSPRYQRRHPVALGEAPIPSICTKCAEIGTSDEDGSGSSGTQGKKRRVYRRVRRHRRHVEPTTNSSSPRESTKSRGSSSPHGSKKTKYRIIREIRYATQGPSNSVEKQNSPKSSKGSKSRRKSGSSKGYAMPDRPDEGSTMPRGMKAPARTYKPPHVCAGDWDTPAASPAPVSRRQSDSVYDDKGTATLRRHEEYEKPQPTSYSDPLTPFYDPRIDFFRGFDSISVWDDARTVSPPAPDATHQDRPRSRWNQQSGFVTEVDNDDNWQSPLENQRGVVTSVSDGNSWRPLEYESGFTPPPGSVRDV